MSEAVFALVEYDCEDVASLLNTNEILSMKN